MTVLKDLAVARTHLTNGDVEHLHRLLGDWQLLADLSFSDLLLYAPVRDRGAYIILAQVRPYPAQTLYHEDMVGSEIEASSRPRVGDAFAERRIVREGEPDWREGTPVREQAIPVVLDGRVVAVVSAEQNLAAARTPSQLELNYLRAAGDLAQMMADGAFPFPGEESEREVAPRVGDGFLRLSRDFTIEYASPNAVSSYRRLGVTGNIVGQHIGSFGIDERPLVRALKRGRPLENEVEEAGAWVLRRFLPVIVRGRMSGALGIVRDVTELRRRDRMLLLKDATIREIHHRVKNNLQTVASLLRLQGRRLSSAEAKAALEESVRRISSIALVHETLSQEAHERVDFDRVALRVLEMVESSLVAPDRPVRLSLQGSAGDLPSEVATPLSLILAELVQNAVEHAFSKHGGEIVVELKRAAPGLHVTVSDDGVGLPSGFSIETGERLGLQIVRTLVTSELGGTIEIVSDEGTRVELEIPLGI